jgi:hypothetical protein
MRRILIVIFVLVNILCTESDAQRRGKSYDSIYYENLFLPNFSNLLMPKGYVEVILSDAVSTSNRFWPDDGPRLDYDFRFTYEQLALIANVGLNNNYRFNVGIEGHYMRAYQDEDPRSSAMNIFKRSPEGEIRSESGLTSVGPRIKWRPFKNNLSFVYTSTFQFATASDNKTMISSVNYWGNQFLYGFSSGKHFSFFLADDANLYVDDGLSWFQNSLSLYSYWIPSKYLFPFVSIGHSIAVGDIGNAQNSVPVGVGLQYQRSLRLSMSVYYSQFLLGQNVADWRTFSVGVRGVF